MLDTVSVTPIFAAHGQELPLWAPGPPPGSEHLVLTESVADTGTANDPRRKVWGISEPTLTVFQPARANGAAAVVLAGGGYTSLFIDHEGSDVARWLNTIGITAFVLKHRLPGEGHTNGLHVPLQDGQRAMRLVRHSAANLGIDAKRIGVVGLSSGGHMASMMGTCWDRKVYEPADAIDATDARPDFMVLGYGPYSANARQCLLKPEQTPMQPPEKQALYDTYPTDQLVSERTPATFLMHTDNDPVVDPRNSIRFYLALRSAKVPAELHIFGDGGHGVAIRKAAAFPVAAWPQLCASWLASLGMIPAD